MIWTNLFAVSSFQLWCHIIFLRFQCTLEFLLFFPYTPNSIWCGFRTYTVVLKHSRYFTKKYWIFSNLANNFPHTGGYELAQDFCSLIIQPASSKFSIPTSLLSICYDWYLQQNFVQTVKYLWGFWEFISYGLRKILRGPL